MNLLRYSLKIFEEFLPCSILATWLVHLNLLRLMTLTILPINFVRKNWNIRFEHCESVTVFPYWMRMEEKWTPGVIWQRLLQEMHCWAGHVNQSRLVAWTIKTLPYKAPLPGNCSTSSSQLPEISCSQDDLGHVSPRSTSVAHCGPRTIIPFPLYIARKLCPEFAIHLHYKKSYNYQTRTTKTA